MDSHADKLSGALQELESPGRIRHLESQVSQLQQAVTSHAMIGQAMGVIVAVGRMTPDEAWHALRETSMYEHQAVSRGGARGHLGAGRKRSRGQRAGRTLAQLKRQALH